jgi:transcriptional regulator with XRE-family HTH domain
MDQLPPIQELRLIETIEKALEKLSLPPLINLVIDYLLGPATSRPQTQLQLSYNKATRQVDWLPYEEAKAFFRLQQDWSIEEYQSLGTWMRRNQLNAQIGAENLRFSIRDFAFANGLSYHHTFPSSPGSVLSFHNAKRHWDNLNYSSAFRTLLEDPHLADLAIEIGLSRRTLCETAHSISFAVSWTSFYEMHEGLHQPLWTIDAFVDFLFTRLPQIMTTHWAYVIVINLDQYAAKFADALIPRLPKIDWKQSDPAIKEQLKAEMNDPRTRYWNNNLLFSVVARFSHNLYLQL